MIDIPYLAVDIVEKLPEMQGKTNFITLHDSLVNKKVKFDMSAVGFMLETYKRIQKKSYFSSQ